MAIMARLACVTMRATGPPCDTGATACLTTQGQAPGAALASPPDVTSTLVHVNAGDCAKRARLIRIHHV